MRPNNPLELLGASDFWGRRVGLGGLKLGSGFIKALPETNRPSLPANWAFVSSGEKAVRFVTCSSDSWR